MKNDISRKFPFLFCLLAFLAQAAVAPAFAETLDEATIRTIYQESKDNITNPSKTKQLMEKRLDDSFVLTQHATRSLGNAPAQSDDERHAKKELIASVMQVYDMLKVQDYRQDIVDIKFSDDHVWAYVAQTSVMNGSISVNIAGTGKTSTSSYADAESCIDTLTLRSGTVRIVRSECKTQTQFTVPQ